MHRILLCIILSFCVLLLPSCSDDSYSSAVKDSSVEKNTTAVVSEISTTSTETQKTSETLKTTETSTEMTETSAEMTEMTETSMEIATELTETVTVESIYETVADKSDETTTAGTVAETTSVSEKMTTSEKLRAEVVIPEITTPLASGRETVEKNNAEIDFSCADDGYISAVYEGGSQRAKLRVKCGNIQYDHDLDADGKREFFPLMGSGSYSVKIYELVTGKSYAEAVSAEFEVNIRSTTGMYLYPNKYADFDSDSECVEKAAELCADAVDEVGRIAAIFGYITDNITYDKKLAASVTSGYIPDPDRTLENGKGICFDYASLMTAMCRSQGIPTRLVIGYAEPDIYHAWNEIYTDETGWITPELFLKKKGYNVADATFYSGNSDKEKIAAYISDESNYSAMYRY